MSLIGCTMKPKVNDFDVSGFKFAFVLCKPGTLTLHWPAKLPGAVKLVGFGHRMGSASVPAKNVCPDFPFSAGPGARKPFATVPRTANSGIGWNLNPSFGLAWPPDRL